MYRTCLRSQFAVCSPIIFISSHVLLVIIIFEPFVFWKTCNFLAMNVILEFVCNIDENVPAYVCLGWKFEQLSLLFLFILIHSEYLTVDLQINERIKSFSYNVFVHFHNRQHTEKKVNKTKTNSNQ